MADSSFLEAEKQSGWLCTLTPDNPSLSRKLKSALLLKGSVDFAHHSVYDAILHGLFRIHPVVAVKIFHDFLESLPTVVCQNLCTQGLDLTDLFRHDLEVSRGSLSTAAGLMDHDLAMGIDEPFAFSPPLSRIEPIEAAIPIQIVETGEEIICMVS